MLLSRGIVKVFRYFTKTVYNIYFKSVDFNIDKWYTRQRKMFKR